MADKNYCIEDVYKELNKKGGHRLSIDQIADYADRLESLFSIKETKEKAVAKLLADEQRIAINDSRMSLQHLLKITEAEVFIDAYAAQLGGDVMKKFRALQAMMVGDNRLVTGGRLNVDARGNAIFSKYIGGMINMLESDKEFGNLFKLFDSGKLDKEISVALWSMERNNGKVSDDIRAMNEPAARIAEIVRIYQDMSVYQQNKNGAYIKKLNNYVVRQVHDARKIKKASAKARAEAVKRAVARGENPENIEVLDPWIEFMKKNIDYERTFDDPTPNMVEVENYLKEVQNSILSGTHNVHGAIDDVPIKVKQINVARKASTERKLHFKSAEAWWEYNEKFGKNSLLKSVTEELERASRNVALMEAFGPNPERAYTYLKNKIIQEAAQSGKPVRGYTLRKLDNMFKEINGETRIPNDAIGARVGRGVRAWNNTTKLGTATISSIADIPMFMAEAKYNGIEMTDATKEVMVDFFRAISQWLDPILKLEKSDQLELARQIGVGLEGLRNTLISRFGSNDVFDSNAAQTAQTLFFKATGLEAWTDAYKAGMGILLSNNMGNKRNLSWKKLGDGKNNNRLRNMLDLYGMDEVDWNLIRSTAFEQDGKWYISPDRIRKIKNKDIMEAVKEKFDLENREDLKIKGELERHIKDYRTDLEDRLRTYFVDRADFAVPTPGARQRVTMTLGTKPGSIEGEAMRFLTQFKSFPLTVAQRVGDRMFVGRHEGGLGSAAMELAAVGASLMAAGFVITYLKDILKGQTPKYLDKINDRDMEGWDWAKLAGQSFVQGGAAAIYGDMVYGLSNIGYGRGLVEVLGGPVFGQLAELSLIYSGAVKGNMDAEKFTTKMAFLMKNNMPMQNLWYTKMATDMLFYRLIENVDPGSMGKRSRRMMKKNEHDYFDFFKDYVQQ